MKEDPGPGALETADPEISELAAVERHVEKPSASGKSGAVEEVLVPARDIEEELSLPGVPVEGEKPFVPGEVLRALGDRGRPVAGFFGGPFGRRRDFFGGAGRERPEEKQTEGKSLHRDLD